MKKEETTTINKFIKEINKGIGEWDSVDQLATLVATYDKYLDCIRNRMDIEDLEKYQKGKK